MFFWSLSDEKNIALSCNSSCRYIEFRLKIINLKIVLKDYFWSDGGAHVEVCPSPKLISSFPVFFYRLSLKLPRLITKKTKWDEFEF